MANRVARSIYRIGRRRGETRREIVSALETGLVESNLKNLPGGDADSAGWRQERASLYKNPTDLIASINRYYDETSAAGNGRGISAGELAARVQRPAAQYRGRYGERKADALRLFQELGGKGGPSGPQNVPNKLILPTMGSTTGQQTGAAFNPYSTIAALNEFSSTDQNDPAQQNYNLLANLYQAPPSAQPATTQVAELKMPHFKAASGGTGGGPRDFLARAVEVNRHHPSYLWGGGHGATPAKLGDRVDCSGYVSQILGVAPRVSGQFARFGDAGPGRQVTIYANSGHVFIQIGNRFFGTSHSNPGGGAGEIPRPPPSYLANFTRRHPRGM